ncbi:MAG: acyl--CoA ligase [Deltaproteobacteria bacterium]|nr:acyl--CoA ligase [Deltaproteobacteria bacterium]
MANQKRKTLIHHFLEHSARAYPDKIALIHGEVRASYVEINNRANHLANWLIENDVSRGDRVVVLLENSLEYVVSYYGVLKAGAVAVPLSTDLKPESLRPLLRELDPSIMISSGKFERILKATDLEAFGFRALLLKASKVDWPASSFTISAWEDICKDGIAPDSNVQIEESDLASIIYTSGSTGTPKGVMLSHTNIVSNTNAICGYLQLTESDVQMVVLPFFYVMGKSLLNTHFAVGGTVVINNRFAFPATVLKDMVEERVTGFSGVPSTYAYLLYRSPLAKYRKKFQTLRYCSQAGGHMSRQIKEELRQAIPEHTKIYIMYGATEASARLTYLEPERFSDKMDSIGKPIPGVQIRVLDPSGNEQPPGELGELVAYGPNIMQGYWKDPETTSRVLDRNGYHTGDVCYKDKEGFFFVQGRRDNLLKVGGHRINTQEIEDAILASGLVVEAVVLGIPDKLLGHKLVALATPKNEGYSKNSILGYCAQTLPKYKVPGSVRLLRALPKNSIGKIDRSKCMEMAYVDE